MNEQDSNEDSKTAEISKSTLNDLLADLTPKVDKCRGAIFKGDVQHCKTERGVLYSIRLNKMQRLSCKGCEQCMAAEDEFGEIDPEHWPILGIEKVKHGKLYTIEYCNIQTDWETGYADSWDLRAVEYSS